MAQSGTYQDGPPRVLPQKRGSFDKMLSTDQERSLPTEYRQVAKALSTAASYKVDLRSVLDPHKSRYTKQLYELGLLTFNHQGQIEYLLNKFYILENNPFLDKWVARVLIAELLWGTQQILSCSDEVEAIKYYEEELRESFVEVMDIFRSPLNLNISTNLPVYVRVNLLKISIEKAIQGFEMESWKLLPPCESYLDHLHKLGYLSEGNYMRDFHVPELFVFPVGTSFYNHPGYLGGKLLLQDKGSCLASALLNPKPGSTVLDLFAAPGVKTNHMANVMNNNGVIYANDIHPERFTTMCKLLELTNVTCVQQMQGHYMDIKDCTATHIMIDPTCSYSGIFWRKAKANQHVRVNQFNSSLTQVLRHVLRNFDNAKRVVFTTCSIFPEEGEKIVDEMMQEFGEYYTLLDLKEILWNEWMNVGSTKYRCGSKCLRTMPEFDLCQGYFIAVFEKNNVESVKPYLSSPAVKEGLRMRIAANGDIVYESTSQRATQRANNNVNYHRAEAASEQQNQYVRSDSFSTYDMATRRY